MYCLFIFGFFVDYFQTNNKILCKLKGYTKLYRKIPWDVYRGMELP